MDRFWAKVAKSDGCWEWTGARWQRQRTKALSYGMFAMNGHLVPAHRMSWELANGPIPAGLNVLHHCDNQGCVRPDHLYLGTHADNTRDAIERHRMHQGEAMWNAKLTPELVRAIRLQIEAGIATEKIGHAFGVSGRTVRYVRAGKRWSHVN